MSWPDWELFQNNCGVSGTQPYFFRASSVTLDSIAFFHNTNRSLRRVLAGVRHHQLFFSSFFFSSRKKKYHFINRFSIACFSLNFHSKVNEMCFSPVLVISIYSIKWRKQLSTSAQSFQRLSLVRSPSTLTIFSNFPNLCVRKSCDFTTFTVPMHGPFPCA